jgi:predicted ATPase
VQPREGPWPTDLSVGELDIPEGVRQVVGQRVARLSRDTAELLRLASGFTGGFDFDVLRLLCGLPEDPLLDSLDEALHAGLIRVLVERLPRYQFAHAIVRHALYESFNTNPDRRARLHRRIALALQDVSAGRRIDNVAELAAQYHASAGLPGAANGLPHALRAAEQARTAFAHDQAATFLRMALDLAADSSAEQRADILCRLAIAEADAVRLDRAQRWAEQALDAMSAANATPEARADFVAAVAQALKGGGAGAEVWEPLVERGLVLVGGQRDLRWARLVLLQDQFEPIPQRPRRRCPLDGPRC